MSQLILNRKKVRPKTYDKRDFVAMLRRRKITPHPSANTAWGGRSVIDGRTTGHDGYRISQGIRKKVEEVVGWMKTMRGFRRTRFKGEFRTKLAGWFVGAVYNLLRMANLLRQGVGS